jgi:hypothetical protein
MGALCHGAFGGVIAPRDETRVDVASLRAIVTYGPSA